MISRISTGSLLGFAFLLLLGLAAAVSAQPWGRGPGRGDAQGCTYYADASFAGERAEVGDGAEIRWVGDRWNDRISSVSCAPRCTLTAYEHIDYGGASTRFSGEGRFVGPQWNDRISSLRVSCRGRDWADRPSHEGPGRCTYFEHANFQGQRAEIVEGRDIASIGPVWNDRISALSCRPGCAVEAFEHVNYQGASERFRGETPFVGPAWNDRISSMRLVCRPR
jgi:hypothetical protein